MRDDEAAKPGSDVFGMLDGVPTPGAPPRTLLPSEWTITYHLEHGWEGNHREARAGVAHKEAEAPIRVKARIEEGRLGGENWRGGASCRVFGLAS